MRMLLIAGVLAGLGPAAVRAEPVQLDENGLRAVAAGAETAAAPISLNVNVTNPVGTGVAVGVNAAVAAFSNNVAATGVVTSSIGLSAP